MGTHRDCDVVVVVVGVARDPGRAAVAARGMDEADARARHGAPAAARGARDVADVLLDNEGTIDELERQVDRLWTRLAAEADGPRLTRRYPAGP